MPNEVNVTSFECVTDEDITLRGEMFQNVHRANHSSHSDVLVLFVHQWGALGGNKDLMRGMASKVCRSLGIDTAVFNHRGVGRSTGRATWTCHEEVQDVVSIVSKLGRKAVILVGSSAGACVAGSALGLHDSIKGAVVIGYPYGYVASIAFGRHYEAFANSRKPRLLIHGEGDGFTSMAQYKSLLERCGSLAQGVVIPRVGHFEMEGPDYDDFMTEQIAKFIERLNLLM